MTFKCLGTSSKGNCYLVTLGSSSLLLDAGIQIDKIINNVNLNDLDFAFISHEHKDHSLSLEKLKNRGVSIIDGATYQEWSKLQINGNILCIFSVEHGITKCSGLIVQNNEECILYITDFFRCKWNLKKFKFTSVIVECNYIESLVKQEMIDENYKLKRQINTHMGLTGLGIFLDTLDLSNCKELILIHQSTDTRIFDKNKVLIDMYSKYLIPIGLCQVNGGVDWFGKDEFNE